MAVKAEPLGWEVSKGLEKQHLRSPQDRQEHRSLRDRSDPREQQSLCGIMRNSGDTEQV